MKNVIGVLLIVLSMANLRCQNGNKIKVIDVDHDAFVHSARIGDTLAMERHLKLGVSVNATNSSGHTALLAATDENNVEMVKWLINKGADIDFFDVTKDLIDQTPFLYAGAYGLDDILDILIPLKPDVHIKNGYGGNALIPACEKGHLSTVRKLLTETEVEVNLVNRLGWTALMETVIGSDGGKTQQEIVKLLLQHGADKRIADKDGVTPMEHAKKLGYIKIMEILRTYPK
jgi:ankyrin repeat protein